MVRAPGAKAPASVPSVPVPFFVAAHRLECPASREASIKIALRLEETDSVTHGKIKDRRQVGGWVSVAIDVKHDAVRAAPVHRVANDVSLPAIPAEAPLLAPLPEPFMLFVEGLLEQPGVIVNQDCVEVLLRS